MSSAFVSREAIDTPWAAYDLHNDVQVNALGVEELFSLYERSGFLYPAKAARLLPHLQIVQDNWRRLLQAGDSMLYVLTSGNEIDGQASVAVWRSTRDSWVWQHLVCERNPLHSRSVMLGGVVRCVRLDIGRSQQNWFRPENRFPARVFGSMVESVGETRSTVLTHSYFAVPRTTAVATGIQTSRRVSPRRVRVVPYDSTQQKSLTTLAALARGPLYVASEELDRDVELTTVDAIYRTVGLRRYRQAWIAYDNRDQAIGAALAYRGPLGLNFSFLENRCDLLLNPGLPADDAASATSALLDAAMAAYEGFELDYVPVVGDALSSPTLVGRGGQLLRKYCQGIWLKEGQPALYRHVDRFYSRLLHRLDRRSTPSALTS